MEVMRLEFQGGRSARKRVPVIVGVVGSGNLEVLVEHAETEGLFSVEVKTTAEGFKPIWAAVIEDCFRRWPLANVHIAINDAGATPAVVSLRLDQALSRFCETQS